MQSIENKADNLYEIKKSKFYSYAYPVFSEREVKDILGELNVLHKLSTHICYAYVLTSPNLEKAVDDGEPSGTAGKPILELIKKRNLKNILLVVVRYFGGIKLGAGGLIRAYTTASSEVLDKTKVLEYGDYVDATITTNHSEYKDVKNYLEKENSVYILDTLFGNNVELFISVKNENISVVKEKVKAILKKDAFTVTGESIRIIRWNSGNNKGRSTKKS